MAHEWDAHRGERVRLSKGEEELEGVLVGPGPALAANGLGENAQQLWRIQLDGGETKQVHPDDWAIQVIEEPGGSSWGKPNL